MNRPKKRKPLDWEAARDRLEHLREWTGRAGTPEAGQVAQAYRRRAALLAEPLRPASEVPGAEAIVIFRAGGERFAVPLSEVAEIIPNPACTPVPGAPPELAGVIQVRGEIRPVCELSRVLGLAGEPQRRSRTVLLLRKGAREFGLRIDAVDDIRMPAAGERRPAPEPLSRHARWMTGDLVPVLDTDVLLEKETR